MLPRRVAPKKVSDLKCVPYKNASMTLTFFSSNFRSFHVRSFTNRSNIFKNVFYVYVFFGTMESLLIIPFVLVREFPGSNA